MSRHRVPTLADVAALAVALERDERRPSAERGGHDQAIAESMTDASGRVDSALAWLDGMCARDEDLRSRREQARSAFGWTGVLMMLLGLLVGWFAALGALYYDGSGRVNVVAVLAVFVVLPAIFLIPFAFAALPRSAMRYVPGAPAATALSRGLSPGRLAMLILRRLPRDWRDAWERLAGRAGARQTLYASVQKWAVLRWSQLFALGFQMAAVSAAIWLVVFSDLAFGWSTTLTSGDPDTDAARVHAVTTAMASPWSWAIDSAEPTFALIRESRYYRAVAETTSPAEAARLGGWWRFLVLAMVVYGLLPRVLTLAISQWRLRVNARGAFSATPGLTAVLNRFHRARVQTISTEPEPLGKPPSPVPVPSSSRGPSGRYDRVVNWSALPFEDDRLSAYFGGAQIVHAGGSATLEADRAIVESLAPNEPQEASEIAIAVKAWEPPLLEFTDFVRDLRRVLGPGRELAIVPLAIDDAASPVAAAPAQLEIWRHSLERLGDPWLRLSETRSEVAE